MTIQENLTRIKKTITAAEIKYKRPPGSVTLVTVSKGQPIEKIQDAIACGQRHFGENYLQEALEKIHELQQQKIAWHYLGRIQSNKSKLIAQNFSWVETVANYRTAELLSKHRSTNLPLLNICIQVNISNELNKAGVLSDEVLPLVKKILSLPNLKLRGLMTIPFYYKEFNDQFKPFSEFFSLFRQLQKDGINIDTISMGMSNDFEAAIAAGATTIRIGTMLFGARANKETAATTAI